MHNSLTLHVAQPAGMTGAQPACLKLHKLQNGVPSSQVTVIAGQQLQIAANLAVITVHILES